ncbi:MAG: hypothetical protein ACK4S4_03970 [Pyrinomonadaceae bacterium]
MRDDLRWMRPAFATRRFADHGAASVAVLFAALLLVAACGSKPSDLREIAPADSLVYIETNDVEAVLRPIVESTAFSQAAAARPDLSALRGVQVAVVVTGFETTENKINDESSVLDFRPHFAAIVDTHLWNWQARSFAENQVGEFVNKIYGGGVQLETGPKGGGHEFIWTAEDGRRVYAFVEGSLLFFANDRSSIDKCLAVRRGEAESFAKTGKAASSPSTLIAGYVSPEGVGQIANVIGAAEAKDSGDDEQLQSFVARVLPQILRGSISDVVWTAAAGPGGVEDRLTFATNAEVTSVLNETLAPADAIDTSLLQFVPGSLPSVTLYSLKDPRIAWRSVLLTAQRLTDPATGQILAGSSNAVFEPYGVRDGEMFLSAVRGSIVTARFDDAGERSVVIATASDLERLRRSLLPELKPDKQRSEAAGVDFWYAPSDDVAAAFVDGTIIAGDAESVVRCLGARGADNVLKTTSAHGLASLRGPAVTVAFDTMIASDLASVLGERKETKDNAAVRFLTETRFTRSGVERRVVSEVGLAASIVAELGLEP